MKQIIIVLMIFPVLTVAQRERNKLGRFEQKLKDDKGFHTVVLDKNLEVDLFYTAADTAIDFEVDPAQYGYIQTKVIDSVLTISSTATIKPRNNWSIRIYFKDLRALKCSNEGKMNLHSNVKTSAFKIQVENGGYVQFRDNTVLEAKSVELEANHRANIDAKLATEHLKVNLEYLSDARLEFVKSLDRADIELKHDCTIDIRGNDTHANKLESRLVDHCDGNLKVLKADVAHLDMFENSKIDISVSQVFDVEITGNSRVNVYGEPKYEFLELKQGSELVNQNN